MASFAVRGYAVLLVLLIALLPSSGSAQARFYFNLPPQPLAQSLRAVGGKAHITVAFDPAAAAGRRAPALKGHYSAHEALERLLRGSGMRVRVTVGGSFWVETSPSSRTPSAD